MSPRFSDCGLNVGIFGCGMYVVYAVVAELCQSFRF